ncbi:MAG: MBL fold metallo-hydrolase [Alphaproteobacteria bacterium]|nr:MBL fold metallo-hydrolase [Alphaproteobacteria bacterium]
MLNAKVIPVTPFAQNCSVLWDTETMKGAFVDPGGDVDKLVAVLEEEGIKLEKILVTHGHLDHAGAVAEVARRFNVPIEGPHKDDLFLIEELPKQSQRFNFPGGEVFTPDRWLENGDEVTVGGLTLWVRHCPGHTPGHVVFYEPEGKIAFVGDVLFQGSIGRTDFPRGDFNQLVESITNNLWPLGDEVRFVPGHGGMSTFKQERMMNPFVSDLALGRA